MKIPKPTTGAVCLDPVLAYTKFILQVATSRSLKHLSQESLQEIANYALDSIYNSIVPDDRPSSIKDFADDISRFMDEMSNER